MDAHQSMHVVDAPVSVAPCDPAQDASQGHFRALTLCADSPDCARAARDLTRTLLTDWGLADVVDDARLVVSELVGNVVHHAIPDRPPNWPGGKRRLSLLLKAWPGWLFIGVADEDTVQPDLPMGEPISPDLAGDLREAVLMDSGRGLLIVQRLADAVWWTPGECGFGKTVWCRFDLDGRAVGSPS